MPADLLAKTWRRSELSPILRQSLELGADDQLPAAELENPAAKMVISAAEDWEALLLKIGVCCSRQSLRGIIDRDQIEQARQTFTAAAVEFARTGRADECIESAEVPAKKLPVYNFPLFGRLEAIAAGFAVWQGAAATLSTSWVMRGKLRVDLQCLEQLAYRDMSRLNIRLRRRLLAAIIATEKEDRPWLQ